MRLLPKILLTFLAGMSTIAEAVTLAKQDLVAILMEAPQVVVADVTEAKKVTATCFTYRINVIRSHPARVAEQEFHSNRPLTVGDRVVIIRRAQKPPPMVVENASECPSGWYADGYSVPSVFLLLSLFPGIGPSLDVGPYILVEAETFAVPPTIRRISIPRVAVGAENGVQELMEAEDGFLWRDVFAASQLPKDLLAP